MRGPAASGWRIPRASCRRRHRGCPCRSRRHCCRRAPRRRGVPRRQLRRGGGGGGRAPRDLGAADRRGERIGRVRRALQPDAGGDAPGGPRARVRHRHRHDGNAQGVVGGRCPEHPGGGAPAHRQRRRDLCRHRRHDLQRRRCVDRRRMGAADPGRFHGHRRGWVGCRHGVARDAPRPGSRRRLEPRAPARRRGRLRAGQRRQRGGLRAACDPRTSERSLGTDRVAIADTQHHADPERLGDHIRVAGRHADRERNRHPDAAADPKRDAEPDAHPTRYRRRRRRRQRQTRRRSRRLPAQRRPR